MENLTPEQLENYLLEYAHNTYQADLKYVEAKESFDVAKDNEKLVFARLVDKQKCTTNVERERQALQTYEWLQYKSSLKELRKNKDLAQIERDNQRRMWETYRSILSSKNNERRLVCG